MNEEKDMETKTGGYPVIKGVPGNGGGDAPQDVNPTEEPKKKPSDQDSETGS